MTPKTVLITGASRGLGASMARRFAERGYRLALTARRAADLEALAAELRDRAAEVVVRELDVTDFDRVAGVIGECAAVLGGIDIVVVNAGVATPTPAGRTELDALYAVIEVNLKGAIATSEAAIRLFREQGHGQLVGITSVAAVRGLKSNSAYCASKAGFHAYLDSLRCDSFGDGIVITELAPGYIDTDLNRHLPSRPFVIDAERGGEIMVKLVEKQRAFSFVPPWPWSLLGRVIRILPLGIMRKF